MNVQLLERVKAHILAEPRRIFMEAWAVSEHMSETRKDEARYNLLEELYRDEHDVGGVEAAEKGFAELLDFPACGTVACIAGWGKILSQPDPDAAARDRQFLDNLYNLSNFESCSRFGLELDQAERLFHVKNWPSEFLFPYEDAASADERARIVADRIDHFIATNGEE